MTASVQTSEFYVFAVDLPLANVECAGALVAFTMSASISTNELFDAARPFFTAFSDIETLILLRPAPRQQRTEETLRRITEQFGYRALKVAAVSIEADRKLSVDPASPAGLIENDRIDALSELIFDAGVRALFDSSGTVMRAVPGYHFEAPGGKHLATFVRTGNMFAHSVSTAFVGAAMLDRFDVVTLHSVRTDTSSINALGYELARLHAIYAQTANDVSIQSLAPGAAIASRPQLDKDSVLIVSVSFTGSYAANARREHPLASIITVIAIQPPTDRRTYLLAPFIGADADSIDTSARTWADCDRCGVRNESVVRIAGDQLIPLAPAIRTRLVSARDAKDWMPAHVEALNQLNAVIAYSPLPTADEAVNTDASVMSDPLQTHRSVYFDLAIFFDDAKDLRALTPQIEALYQALDQKVDLMKEFSPTHIVHADDPSTKSLIDYLVTEKGLTAEIISINDLKNAMDRLVSAESCKILVVAAVVSSGRTLAEISKALRPALASERTTIEYFAFISRTENGDRWLYLTSRVGAGAGNVTRATVHDVLEVWLPVDRAFGRSVWDEELEFWEKRVREPRLIRGRETWSVAETTAIDQIDERVKWIQAGGFRNRLFVTSANDINSEIAGERLSLQGNFMWWESGYDTHETSQAIVFMNFLGVLEATRGPRRIKAEKGIPEPDRRFFDTTQHSHNIMALHPMNFDRYDDGITQAALLRASLRHELDYSGSRALSSAMLTVLVRVVDEFRAGGESSLCEFLLALGTGRLRLHPRDFRYFLAILPADLPPVASLLKEYLVDLLEETISTAIADSS